MDGDNQQIDSTSEQNANESTSSKPRQSQSIAWLALLIALGASGVSFWEWQHFQQQKENSINLVARLEGVMQMQEQLSSDINQQQTIISHLELGVNRLRMRAEADNDGWLLAEIDHLIRLADYHTTVDKDSQVSLRLLKVAQQRSNNLSDPAMRSLRQTIANSIASLESVTQIPIERIVVRLNALSQTLGELPLSDSYIQHDQVEQEKNENLPVWRLHLQANLKRLQNVVSIRRIDKPSQAMLPPQQHASLIENIQLQLSMAQWAVLHGKNEIYQQSLDQAALWIKKYLRETTATAAVLQGLDELKKLDVAPKIPSLSAVVEEVQQAMVQQAKRPIQRPDNDVEIQQQPQVQTPNKKNKGNQDVEPQQIPEIKRGPEVISS